MTAADLPVRVIAPNYASSISDGQRNGTSQMRYSLIGRETANDGVCLRLEGSDVRGLIAIVACDKPQVRTLAAILEHDVPRDGVRWLDPAASDFLTVSRSTSSPPSRRRRMTPGGGGASP